MIARVFWPLRPEGQSLRDGSVVSLCACTIKHPHVRQLSRVFFEKVKN